MNAPMISQASITVFVLALIGVGKQTLFAASLTGPGIALQSESLNFEKFFAAPQNQTQLSEGLELFRAGKFAEAAAQAEAALKAEPKSSSAHQLLGASQAKLGDLKKAVQSFERAVELAPQHVSPLMQLGDACLALGEFSRAREIFTRAAAIQQGLPEVHQGLGLAYEQEGRVAEAIPHYEIGITGLSKEYLGVRVNLARLYNEEQQFKKTIDLMAPLLTEKQTNVAAHQLLGVAYLGLGQFENSIRYYQRAFSLSPSDEMAFGLGVACRNARRFPESVNHLQYVIRQRSDWFPGYFQIGETYLAMSDLKSALLNFQKAESIGNEAGKDQARMRIGEVYLIQKAYPQAIVIFEQLAGKPNATWDSFDRLATAYRANNQMPLVEQTLKKAVAKYPNHSILTYKLGLFYGTQNRPKEALVQFEKAAQLEPKNPAFQKSLSTALNEAGQRDKAIQVAERLAVEHPNDAEPKLFLASLYSLDGKDALASKLYREVLKTEPDRVLALNNLAMILGRKAEYHEAELLLQKAIALAPKSGQLLDSLGWILYSKGDTNKALELLKQSAELSPVDPSILYHLGMAFLKSNQKQAALDRFNRAIAISRTFPEYDHALKIVRELSTGTN